MSLFYKETGSLIRTEEEFKNFEEKFLIESSSERSSIFKILNFINTFSSYSNTKEFSIINTIFCYKTNENKIVVFNILDELLKKGKPEAKELFEEKNFSDANASSILFSYYFQKENYSECLKVFKKYLNFVDSKEKSVNIDLNFQSKFLNLVTENKEDNDIGVKISNYIRLAMLSVLFESKKQSIHNLKNTIVFLSNNYFTNLQLYPEVSKYNNYFKKLHLKYINKIEETVITKGYSYKNNNYLSNKNLFYDILGDINLLETDDYLFSNIIIKNNNYFHPFEVKEEDKETFIKIVKNYILSKFITKRKGKELESVLSKIIKVLEKINLTTEDINNFFDEMPEHIQSAYLKQSMTNLI